MNKNKLKKLFRKLKALRLRKGNIKGREMVRFAKACGRKLRPGGKGSEPTYLNEWLKYSKPLSIPGHTDNIPPGTAGNILDFLEQDLFEIEELIDKESRGSK